MSFFNLQLQDSMEIVFIVKSNMHFKRMYCFVYIFVYMYKNLLNADTIDIFVNVRFK